MTKTLMAALASLCLMALACPAIAYTPQTLTSQDRGQDFTKVPAGTAWNASNGINRSIWSNIYGTHLSFTGSSGLQISSAAANGWPTTGMMQSTSGCSAGFGYGDFHYRIAVGAINQGPGSNAILWPSDGDPAWPGIIKNSDDNRIGEVDVMETNFASNGTAYSTVHYYNGAVSGHNGQIMHSPDSYLAGNMTSMHDYDVIWGNGTLKIKIDGVTQLTAPPTQVRKDYAHGGCNYTLGAQMTGLNSGYDHTPTDVLNIAAMWWSATDGSAGAGTSVAIPQ